MFDFVYCGRCLNPRDVGQRYMVEKCSQCGDPVYQLSIVSPPPEKDLFAGEQSIWCGMCQGWIERSELVKWTGDDALHQLCPGCDSDLVPIQMLEQ